MNLYSSFTLIRTTLYIVHGQYVSLYNIQENQWIKHCKFEEGNIVCLVKKVTESGDDGNPKHEIAILLENGDIYNDMQKTIFTMKNVDEDNNEKLILTIDSKERDFQVPGKIIKTA